MAGVAGVPCLPSKAMYGGCLAGVRGGLAACWSSVVSVPVSGRLSLTCHWWGCLNKVTTCEAT